MITVVKIGGNVIDDPAALAAFVRDFVLMEGPKILVHGGGAAASALMRRLGLEPVMIEGRRVTDLEALNVAAMVYAGLINKSLVAQLQATGCDAMGMAGCDGNVLRSVRRAAQPIDFGFVGDPAAVNARLLHGLVDGGVVPVLCAITHNGAGQLLNTNADTVASAVAAALGARLIFCFEKSGVLRADGAVAPVLGEALFAAMRAHGEVTGGMIAKLENAFSALRRGAAEVVIKHAGELLVAGAGTSVSIDN